MQFHNVPEDVYIMSVVFVDMVSKKRGKKKLGLGLL